MLAKLAGCKTLELNKEVATVVNPRAKNRTDELLVRTNLQRPTSALRLRRDVRVEFERARAGRVEEASRQTTIAVERVGRLLVFWS